MAKERRFFGGKQLVGELRIADCGISIQNAFSTIRVSILRNHKPNGVYFQLALLDRSEMTSAEFDLNQTLEQWSSLVHSAPEIIMLVLPDGQITFANRPWLAQDISGNVGHDVLSFIPAEEQSKVYVCLGRTLHYGSLESCEIHLNHRPDDRWFNLRFRRVDPIGGPATADSPRPHRQVILIIRDITESKQAEAMLRGLSARSEEIREDERVRIAREIHDELGQLLTVLKMDLAWLKVKARGGGPVRERVELMDGSVDTMIQTVRRIASELGPPMLRDLGLIPALEWQLNQFQEGRHSLPYRCPADRREDFA